MQEIVRVPSAEVGIPAGAILDTLLTIEKIGLEMHSFLLMRHGKLAAEVYYDPITADSPQRTYSITKSLTALAIGQLIQGGKLELTDPVADYFPEYLSPDTHPWTLACTVRDLLCMQSCHRDTAYKRNPAKHWVKRFFTKAPVKPPGELFHYDTSASHVLGALVEKVSGQTLLDFLRAQFLDQIGFGGDAYIIPDPFGVSTGGSGLVATSMDLLRLGALFLDGGKWGGKQLLAEDFFQAATSAQVVSNMKYGRELAGYGYQFWRIQGDGFAAVGKGGQYLACWPQHDLVMVTTADTQDVPGGGERLLLESIDGILPMLDTGDTEETAAQSKLEEFAQNAAIRPISSGLAQADFSGSYVFQGPSPISEVRWAFGTDGGVLEIVDEAGRWQIAFGIGRVVTGQLPRVGGLYAATAGWLTGRELHLRVSLLQEDCSSIRVRAAFSPEGCTMEMGNTCESVHANRVVHKLRGFGKRV